MSRKEIDLHSEILEILKIERIIDENDSWGSAGPDIYIKGKAIIEIKRSDSNIKIEEAYNQIFARTKEEWKPENLHYISIITPKQIQIYRNKDKTYNKCFDYDLQFDYKTEFNQFLHFIKNDHSKIEITLFLQQILINLYKNTTLDHLIIIRLLLNIDKKITFFKQGIIFNQEQESEFVIESDNETLTYAKELTKKYTTNNIEKIKDEIRHNWSNYQIDSKKSSLGKYYTPKHLIDLIKNYSLGFLQQNPDAYVLDSCAGCGSFLEAFKQYNIIGRDIDVEAVEILKELGYYNIAFDNSLLNSNREKYNISNDAKLIAIGNPPYNDVSSKNKRYGTNQKINQKIEIDKNIHSRDYGMAFLKHYATLKCEEIIVLHPLSYLTKEANFKQLGFFTSEYILKQAIIFSSNEFGSALKDNKTQFPIVCARYTKGSMNYDYIKAFSFEVLNQKNTFSIKDLYTIDDYGIRKYPASKNMIKESDINLYHYNIRDTNSLKTSGNFSSTYNHNMITVSFENLYQYAYLNCYRRYFPNDFLLGNISPICDKKMLESQEFRDICIMDLIINNQSLESLNIKSKNSFLYKNFVINDFRRKTKDNNLYQKFIDFVNSNYNPKNDFKVYFDNEFKKLYQNTLLQH